VTTKVVLVIRERVAVVISQKIPGMIWPVVAYAPKAATKPIIAAHPLNFSASGVIRLKRMVDK